MLQHTQQQQQGQNHGTASIGGILILVSEIEVNRHSESYLQQNIRSQDLNSTLNTMQTICKAQIFAGTDCEITSHSAI